MSIHKGRKGQSLAEFAITLPILLVLLFGIVEMGRIFQAWVTLQNAARAAARYASTGQFDQSQFPINLELNAALPSDWKRADKTDYASFVPCVDDGLEPDRTFGVDGPAGLQALLPNDGLPISADRRGTKTVYTPPGAFSLPVEIYQGGIESLFATWNDGKNCDPRSDFDQERRRDMVRLLSIIQEARQGAAGLAIEADSFSYPADKTLPDGQPWFAYWQLPQPRHDQRAWFNVVICSTRAGLDTNSDRYFTLIDNDGSQTALNRFITYTGENTLRDASGQDVVGLPTPACLLNEIPQSTGDNLNNAGRPWLDPGGPADTVTVIISFNHPLVTPLGLGAYIPMQARRTAIVESFRATDPRVVLGGGKPIRPAEPTLTPSNTPTDPPPLPPSPSPSLTPTRQPTNTPTLPPPFSCSLITVSGLTVEGGQVSAEIRNQNTKDTFITHALFQWPTISQYQNMAVIELALNHLPHWRGRDMVDINAEANTTDTHADPSSPNYFNDPQYEASRIIAAYDLAEWSATFSNGPARLQQFTAPGDYGISLWMFNPLDEANPCLIEIPAAPEQGTIPTALPVTPDCETSQIRVQWGGFEAFGVVRLEIYNERNTVAVLSDFVIQWRQRAPGILTLSRVSGSAPLGQPGSVTIWQASTHDQDSAPPTSGRNDNAWVQNFTIDAANGGSPSVTNLYLDFDGVGGLLSDIGLTPADFNGTQLRMSCGPVAGIGDGFIRVVEMPTPLPPTTRAPTNTPHPPLPPTTPPPTVPTTVPTTPAPTLIPTTPAPTNPPPPQPTLEPPTLPPFDCMDSCG